MNKVRDRMNWKTNRGRNTISLTLFTVLLLYTLVFASVVSGIYEVKGNSMIPTLQPRTRVVVLKGAVDIKKGDLVVYNSNPHGNDRELSVKRVMAVGGDTVTYSDGMLSVNGEQKPEHSNSEEDKNLYSQAFQLEHNQYWLIGDNLKDSESIDSRKQGIVKGEHIVGKVINTRK